MLSIPKNQSLNPAISLLFLGYFIVLFAERSQSLVRVCSGSVSDLYRNRFDGYVNTLTVFSLIATVVLLIFANGKFWRSLFNASITPDYSILAITAGVLLLSGMVHTEYTVAPVQFVSYGLLAVAMILRTVQVSAGAENRFRLWYSLVFLIVFSMAIPVMYRSGIRSAALFHTIEAIVALALVVCFSFMLRELMIGKGENLLCWIPMLIAAVGDAAILAMRWREKVNSFVLIFILLAALLFVLGKILFAVTGRNPS